MRKRERGRMSERGRERERRGGRKNVGGERGKGEEEGKREKRKGGGSEERRGKRYHDQYAYVHKRVYKL